MPASPWLAASNGLITGGALAILADIAFGISVETEHPAATPYTTAKLSLSFLRPARPNGTLSAGGQAIHVGRSVGLSEAFLIDEETDRLVAHGTSRLTIFPPIDPPPEPPETLDAHAAPAYDSPDRICRIVHLPPWAPREPGRGRAQRAGTGGARVRRPSYRQSGSAEPLTTRFRDDSAHVSSHPGVHFWIALGPPFSTPQLCPTFSSCRANLRGSSDPPRTNQARPVAGIAVTDSGV